MIKSKKQMFIVIGAFTLVVLLGTVTYAFFNYTRTGSSNVIKTGRISFTSSQDGNINLTNVFPIDKKNINSDTNNVGSVSIHITGDTTYSGGIEYLVTAVNVNNSVGEGINAKNLPISVSVDYEETSNNGIGILDSQYFDNRGGSTSLYKILAGKTVSDGSKLLVGYIANGQTGIDGTINIKAYIDKDRIAISDTYPEGEHVEIIGEDTYEMNSNVTSEDINNCVTYFTNMGFPLRTGESYENFCRGTGTLSGMSLQSLITKKIMINELMNMNIIVQTGHAITNSWTNGTTGQWLNDRMVLTTDEWNNLSSNGISFKVKVEANEGIWVERQGNAMNTFPYIITDHKIDIKEIYFNKMSTIDMHNAYDNATIKADLTYNNEGEVLAWLEENEKDNTKYNLIIASDGETYLTTGKFLFGNVNYAEKIEFNNVNTSRITTMEDMFYEQYNLSELDLRNLDMSNVINIRNFVYRCPKITRINMSGLDLKKVQDMSGMFYSNEKLVEVNLSGLKTRDVTNMRNMFYYSDNILSINLDNLGGDNLSILSPIFSSSSKIQNISMKQFNFGHSSMNYLFSNLGNVSEINLSNAKTTNVTDMGSLFSGCSSLTILNLSGFNTSGVTNMSTMFNECSSLTRLDLSDFDTSKVTDMNGMFSSCSSLKKIYVSNTWNTDNVDTSSNTFVGCTSLVGGAGTSYDANHIDKTYARIDGGTSSPGYLTLKTN